MARGVAFHRPSADILAHEVASVLVNVEFCTYVAGLVSAINSPKRAVRLGE